MIPSPAQIDQFRNDGFFLSCQILDHAMLDEIATDFERLRAEEDASVRAAGERRGISMEGRNFIPQIDEKSKAGRRLCLSAELVELAIALIGPDIRLYWNQAVTKAPGSGASFSWHQDSGYHHIDPLEYLTIWVPLEDSTIENGTICVIPGSQKWGLQEHIVDPDTGDKVGYRGPEQGIPVEVKKGEAAVFSSMCLHRSGPNTTDNPRSAYVVQYSPIEAVDPESGERWGGLLEVARNGRVLNI